MDCLIDNKAEILWYRGDFGYEDDKLTEELNSWKKWNIKKYITDGGIGDFLHEEVKENKNHNEQFFGFINNKLVATIVMNFADELRFRPELKQHLVDCSTHSYFNNGRYLSKDKAIDILRNDKVVNNDYLMYVIVHPNSQGKGYGTRVLSSVKNNIDFFAVGSFHNSLSARVYSTNDASCGIFEKNNFKPLARTGAPLRYFKTYFLEEPKDNRLDLEEGFELKQNFESFNENELEL